MNEQEFTEHVQAVVDRAHNDLVSLVRNYLGDEAFKESMPKQDDGHWNRPLDGLAETVGWVYDKLEGRVRPGRGSMTKKIRKALGYSMP